ncbi:Beta-barrel assembly-enhancing protease [Arthrobacter sp. Bi26]|uniref:J domain-containing protein n=1 Tax=Arthrobacter sp. Bi26 TaxID=2822350 RepID=UPI001DF41A38|nr:tetratricopeptide repeat protein [Arthrobacter sp. Bi26]CAH0232773.1 Beta-barrel assembly-enhancing protease [Arthrobacter sp. Bi26]
MPFVNYYEILGIERGAGAATITQAAKQKRADWLDGQSDPVAATRVLAEAEVTLLDPIKRADFDRQLAAHESTPERTFADAVASERDWVVIAREYLESGTASQANYAAREATTQRPENPEAWYIRGVTSTMLGNARDAEFELGEAARLDPYEASYHCTLGDTYRANGDHAGALRSYQRASDLEPESLFYQSRIGVALNNLDRVPEALTVFKLVHEAEPDNELYKGYYGLALMSTAQQQWSQHGDGTSSILTKSQLDVSRESLRAVADLKCSDPTAREQIDEFKNFVNLAERKKWHRTRHTLLYMFLFFLPLFLMFRAIDVPNFIIALALFGLVLIVFVKRHHMPNWKWDSRHVPNFVRTSGLQ